MDDIELPPETLDLAFLCASGLSRYRNLLETNRAMLASIFRACKPGGRFVVIERQPRGRRSPSLSVGWALLDLDVRMPDEAPKTAAPEYPSELDQVIRDNARAAGFEPLFSSDLIESTRSSCCTGPERYDGVMFRTWIRPLVVAVALAAATGIGMLACPYDAPWWSECCQCACEDCDAVPDRAFAADGDAVDCWEECDTACAELADQGCGEAVNVTDCPVELCIEYVGLGEACDGQYGESDAPTEMCRYYFLECEDPDWICSGGVCAEQW